MTELAHYALDLVDRLSYQLRQLDIHDQRDNLARVFDSWRSGSHAAMPYWTTLTAPLKALPIWSMAKTNA